MIIGSVRQAGTHTDRHTRTHTHTHTENITGGVIGVLVRARKRNKLFSIG